ncbi:NLR family CARD domain-containing protein 3-like isoform X2 [Nelusetta ayraudi]|uniref:NLR family CARD domain-containing protein 3-like isoform X2 n=1 Tax=Nelusetta ayraudi TaxID=303726 RepID=UPI003F6F9C1C
MEHYHITKESLSVRVEEEEDGAAESPEFSCVSLKSDHSKGLPQNISNEPGVSETQIQFQGQSAESPGFSCVSLKSDHSKKQPLHFSKEPGAPETQVQYKEKRAEAPGFSGVSLKSDHSKEELLFFSKEPGPPQCGAGLETASHIKTAHMVDNLQELLQQHKISLERRCEHVSEGTNEAGIQPPLNSIYTELYITEGQSEDVNRDHEVRQLETKTKKSLHNRPISCSKIFEAFPEQQGDIRVVLTNGVAGVGKTFSVQKFTLDWAQGLENQDLHLVVPLSFRELNLVKEQHYSLLELLRVFHPTLEKLTSEQVDVCKLLFILDGLDENRLSLDFGDNQVVTDVTQKESVRILLTNLIRGTLLPSALVWITSRPAAANQIPPTCVDRLTEVRGFTDDQKEEYFRRRFRDKEDVFRIISHIEVSRSLHIMCQIPVFCWITATVLEAMLSLNQTGELPKTLTDMYSHFLLVQTKRKKQKYEEGHQITGPQELTEDDKEVLLKLGWLAFEHLESGNIMFYSEDLEKCGLSVTDALVYSGVCTEIFRRESVIFQKTIYCFVHLSVQEFLAAVYIFHCHTNRKRIKYVRTGESLDLFLKRMMKKSMETKNGQLDLFIRFLHGLCLESNQSLLRGLIGHTDNHPGTLQKVINNLKAMNSKDVSTDRSINIFHCLLEVKDQSVHQEAQEFLSSEKRSKKKLSDIQCSALAYILQMSEEVLDELDLQKYKTSWEGSLRLIPAVRNCKKAVLSKCQLSKHHCEVVASALESSPSTLTLLDMSGTKLEDPSVKLLCAGLESPNCRLEVLRLIGCSWPKASWNLLATALTSNPSHLRELDLSKNKMQDSALELLSGFLQSPGCKLKTLKLRGLLSEIRCDYVARALKSNPSHLRLLDISHNKLLDSGVEPLTGFLQSPFCKLKILRLSWCSLTEISCNWLASALKSNPSHLRELELGAEKLPNSAVELLSGFLKSPDCNMEYLGLRNCSLSEISCGLLASALKSNPSHFRQLDLSENRLQDSTVKLLRDFLQNPECKLETLRLNSCSLPKTSCDWLVSALNSNPSHLKLLDLGRNQLQDSDVELLRDFLQSPDFKLETLRWK